MPKTTTTAIVIIISINNNNNNNESIYNTQICENNGERRKITKYKPAVVRHENCHKHTNVHINTLSGLAGINIKFADFPLFLFFSLPFSSGPTN